MLESNEHFSTSKFDIQFLSSMKITKCALTFICKTAMRSAMSIFVNLH